jgi:hypothetical protein
MTISIEATIRAVIAEEVAAAERRIRESLNVQSDVTLTFQEACDYLHMSEYTLRILCRKKKIPYRMNGVDGSKNPRYLFSSSSLDQWKRRQEELNYEQA